MMPHRGTPGSPAAAAAASRLAAERHVRAAAAAIDWPEWLRATERKRRQVARNDGGPSAGGAAPAPAACPCWPGYFEAATDASFRLDGLVLPPDDLAAALARGSAGKAFRSRQQQRARNHVAILRSLEKLLRTGGSLKPGDVVRWYTSIACGLSTTRLDEPTTARLEAVVRRINSPQLRLKPAVQEIALLYRQWLSDPLVPSFNGILARLLLRYHLGRCGLPPVLFVPELDGGGKIPDERRMLERLLALIDAAYATLLGTPNVQPARPTNGA
jgi:hypothetical protein